MSDTAAQQDPRPPECRQEEAVLRWLLAEAQWKLNNWPKLKVPKPYVG